MFNYNDILNEIDGEDFEERPVDLKTFLYDEEYLGLKVGLSDNQVLLVRACTQIYKLETLIALHGEEEGRKRYAQTYSEVIFQLGKGSGKDFCSVIACCYVVYLLLCLRDPAIYYGKESGDTIDIINVAINSDQARNVFFKNLLTRVQKCPWFAGKYTDKQAEINFIKSINIYSGHSEREAFEGYNLFYCVLDEISGFALDSNSGNIASKTAKAIYDMYSDSVTSRFELGKLVLLSFPRYKDDFIQQRYNAVVQEKHVIDRTHTFKLDESLPDGIENNEFEITWEEDHIISYKTPGVFALKRPSWEVNPKRRIEGYMKRFYDDQVTALMKYACMPPLSISGFFKDEARVNEALQGQNGVDETGQFQPWFAPEDERRYFIHVDLARKIDRCAVTLAHVDKWERRQIGANLTEPAPVVKVDAIRYWTPSKQDNVDFADVREYIVDLARKGFDIRLVTFDRWESDEMIKYLNSVSIRAEKLSVDRPHYTDLALLIGERRLTAPQNSILQKELLQLMILPNGKLDHPRDGSKDLADSMCGAVYNAISHTPRNLDVEIEILTSDDIRRQRMEAERLAERDRGPALNSTGPIKPPPVPDKMPADLEDFVANLRVV